MLTGQTDKTPRHGIFYFSDDGDLTALRYHDWTAIFLEQRAEATLLSWRESFVYLRHGTRGLGSSIQCRAVVSEVGMLRRPFMPSGAQGPGALATPLCHPLCQPKRIFPMRWPIGACAVAVSRIKPVNAIKALGAGALLLVSAVALAQPPTEGDTTAADRSVLPMPLSPFEGKIGKTYQDSESAWQHPPAAPAGAPNVIVILLDDVGFGQTSTFGGLIPTPNLDQLAS